MIVLGSINSLRKNGVDMKYSSDAKRVDQFDFVSTNQHGDRYKRIESKYVHTVTLSAKFDNAADLLDLVALSDQLNVPVHYNFGEQEAYMILVSAESI